MPDHEESLQKLCDFIRSSGDAVIGHWTEGVRKLSPARELSRSALVNHLPEVLVRLADIVESTHNGRAVPLAEAPRKHALDRLSRGFDLEHVIGEFSLLRQCILSLWERDIGSTIAVSELRRLDAALDQSIAESAVSFARARERMLRAVDRISEAALGTSDLDSFLQKILQATLETTEAVDTAAVFLREGDVLRMRAAVGMEEEVSRRFTLRIGEGVAGKVAAEAQPILLRHAATDPLVKNETLREKGVRALYGVPLSHAGEVIAVAFMGSRTAYEFSEEDRLLFRTMASRATAVIVQAQLIVDLAATALENAKLFREAERAIRQREEILAVVSHDLRNPLSIIDMNTRMLLDKGGADARTLGQLETILRATRRMDHLIGDLLDMASIQAGRLAVELRAQPIAPIIVEAVEIAGPLARANKQTLSTEIDIDDARCAVDRDRVLQVLSNLLGNAKKFSPTGSTITVRAAVKDDAVECSVSDTGPGIDPSDLPHVFDPYWSAKHEAGKGVGLGLHISKAIVEAHGGRIWIETQVGGGSTFYFTLPLERARPQESPSTRS